MDEASRYIVAYGVLKETAAPNTLQILKEEIQHHGETDEILTDRGTESYAGDGERKEKDMRQIEQYLVDKGIRHILRRVTNPQTNGKLERFYGVLENRMIRGAGSHHPRTCPLA